MCRGKKSLHKIVHDKLSAKKGVEKTMDCKCEDQNLRTMKAFHLMFSFGSIHEIIGEHLRTETTLTISQQM